MNFNKVLLYVFSLQEISKEALAPKGKKSCWFESDEEDRKEMAENTHCAEPVNKSSSRMFRPAMASGNSS